METVHSLEPEVGFRFTICSPSPSLFQLHPLALSPPFPTDDTSVKLSPYNTDITLPLIGSLSGSFFFVIVTLATGVSFIVTFTTT